MVQLMEYLFRRFGLLSTNIYFPSRAGMMTSAIWLLLILSSFAIRLIETSHLWVLMLCRSTSSGRRYRRAASESDGPFLLVFHSPSSVERQHGPPCSAAS